MDPVDEGYEPNIELLPRGSEAEVNLVELRSTQSNG
jgi:hypothetical protein